MESIRIGIAGYGNLGKGVEQAIGQNEDMLLCGIFTRRDPGMLRPITPSARVYPFEQAMHMQDQIDVMILCGGSVADLPVQTPLLARLYNTVDSFDTHAKIPAFFSDVDQAAQETHHVSIISAGWDPGLFSLNRMYARAVLPEGIDYTFWGRGVSQGHSNAIRSIPGVQNAVQYTIPVESTLASIRSGDCRNFTPREKHLRECFVVLEPGADADAVERQIKTMPNYFCDYDTTVHFITAQELQQNHQAMPQGGVVIRNGRTGGGYQQRIEYEIKLESNPEFTANILVAYARAAWRLHKRGCSGAKTVLDIAPADISIQSGEALRRELL